MISLVLVVCLTTSPGLCREEMPAVEIADPMACMVQGQQIAAEWLRQHPKWSLRGWRCRLGREKQS